MSRLIKMTPEYLNECRADFEKALTLAKLSDGKLSFTKTFSSGSRKAIVYFTPAAWAKMVILINEFEKEVAWHGVAHRLGEAEGEQPPAGEEREYIITDILVYPQEVSAATVEMDTGKYANWLMENIEDERFNNIRMQGHSHVRMPPTPSSVDLNHQEEILNMLGDNDFYIFMIWNKMFASNVKVYDIAENTLFEHGDVKVQILDEVGSIDEFLKDAKAMVKDRPYTSYQTQRPPYSGVNNHTGQTATGSPYNPLPASTGQGSNAKKTEEKKDGKPRTRINAGWSGGKAALAQQTIFPEDEDDGPYNWSGR